MTEPTSPPPPSPPPPPETPASTSSGDGGGGGQVNSLMLILSYLYPLSLVPFFVEKEDDYIQWHAKQGVVMFVVEFIVAIVFFVLSMAINAFTGCLGCFLYLPQMFFHLALLIARIICVVKGLDGERYRVPLMADWSEKI